MHLRVLVTTSVLGALASTVSFAAAQTAAPAPQAAPQPLGSQPPAPPGAQPAPPGAQPPPPPGYAYPPPPPNYTYPPPPPYGYPPPPGYAYPKAAPATLNYDGGPIPPGYRVEERYRKGLVVVGPILVGAPWMLGLLIASADNYNNKSSWLAVPVLGPWITLGARHRSQCNINTFGDCINATTDSTVQTALVFDGLVQGAGATMLIIGLASPKKVLVREVGGIRLELEPTQIGRTGYGAMLSGQF